MPEARKRRHQPPSASTRGDSKPDMAKAKRALTDLQRECLKDIERHLIMHPDEILQTKAVLDKGQIHREPGRNYRDANRIEFPSTYTLFKSLPKYWVADWMVVALHWSKEFVDLIDAAKPGQIKQAFTYVTGCSDFTWWPPALRRVELLRQFLSYMVSALGNRHEGFEAKVPATGIINWQNVGPYIYTWGEHPTQGHVVTKIEHKSTRMVATLAVVCIDSDFELLQPWDDIRAQFVKERENNKPYVEEQFPSDADFKKKLSRKHFSDKEKELREKWEKEQQETTLGDEATLVTLQRRRKQALADRSKARVPSHKVTTKLTVVV